MEWLLLVLAGVFEMFGVAMINRLDRDRRLWRSGSGIAAIR